jgi:hypothetical protein
MQGVHNYGESSRKRVAFSYYLTNRNRSWSIGAELNESVRQGRLWMCTGPLVMPRFSFN